MCNVSGVSAFTAPIGSTARAGAAVTILSIGADPADQNTSRVLVTGAPDRLSGEADGQVFLKVINPSTGTVPFTLSPGTPTAADQVLAPPADCNTGGICNFGRTLLAADIMECVIVDSTTLPWTTVGCGQELLVGAPSAGHGTSTGRVLIYRHETGPGANGILTLVGEVPVPATASLGDEFGFAMAAQQQSPPGAVWEVAPDHPAWVAISAPATGVPSGSTTEDGVVYIYEVNPTSSMPLGLAPVQAADRISAGGHGADVRLGHALAVGDFDFNGLADLAAGAPRPDGSPPDQGNVWVHFGDGSSTDTSCVGTCAVSPLPFQRGGVTASGNLIANPGFFDPSMHPTAVTKDRFGASLSVGLVVDVDNNLADTLVVGAPEHDLGGSPSDNFGAICWFEWDSSASLITNACAGSVAPVLDDQFGFSVQTGNFNLTDARGVVDDEFGPIHEVAVGSLNAAGGTGMVEIITGSPDDGPMTDEVLTVLMHPDGGLLAGERFGRALGAGFGQSTAWEDLVIGSPQRDASAGGPDGSATLTKAIPINACSPPEVTGEWTMTDHGGTPVRLRVFQEQGASTTKLQFVDEFEMHLYDNFGAGSTGPAFFAPFCEFNVGSWWAGGSIIAAQFTIPADTVLDLDRVWPCGVGSFTFPDVPAEPIVAALAPLAGHPGETIPGEVIDVTLNKVSSTELQVTFDIAKLDFARLNLSPADCRVANTATTPHPFETTRGVDLCEP